MSCELNSENFDIEINQAGVYAVRFWAVWCGPCRVMAPVFKAVAQDLQGAVKFGEVDLDKFPMLAARYGVQSVPTVLLFKDGNLTSRAVGALPRKDLLNFVSK
jgi:thioredoxin 1